MKSIEIPNSVTSIGDAAFHSCSGLTFVTIGNSVTSIGTLAFYGCSSLTSIIIPNSVTLLENGVFYDCTSLTSITIPNSVTSIGSSAFDNCEELTDVTIGCGVKSIGIGAFKKCAKLTDVYCYAENVPSTNSIFQYSNISNATLHVPAASVEAYKTTYPWSEFGNIVAIPGTAVRGDVNGDGEVGMPDVMFVLQKILNGKFPDE